MAGVQPATNSRLSVSRSGMLALHPDGKSVAVIPTLESYPPFQTVSEEHAIPTVLMPTARNVIPKLSRAKRALRFCPMPVLVSIPLIEIPVLCSYAKSPWNVPCIMIVSRVRSKPQKQNRNMSRI